LIQFLRNNFSPMIDKDIRVEKAYGVIVTGQL
jgi:hypothetical protein